MVAVSDRAIKSTIKHAFGSNSQIEVITSHDEQEIVDVAVARRLDLIIVDLEMTAINCRKLLLRIKQEFPEIQIIVITGRKKIDEAVECLRLGAFDYLIKPIEKRRFVSTVGKALEAEEMRRELSHLKESVLKRELMHPRAFSEIITNNKKMKAIFQYIEAFAPSAYPVVITGETGVGKELIAHAIHRVSGRDGEFVAVNVAGLDDNMFADTLFGHKVGAFTGAEGSRKGMIEKAACGTLFLDEIGDLGQTSQIKLLRLLQEKEYYPLGADEPKRTDARIIVATNRNLASAQEEGRFRKDLYFRLRSHHVHIPPLRERLDDLPLLLDYFLDKTARELGKRKPTPPTELMTLLSNYHFPGNIRELEVMTRDAVASHDAGVLSMAVFKDAVGVMFDNKKRRNTVVASSDDNILSQYDKLPPMQRLGDLLILEALKRSNGNQSIASRLIGISRQTLNRRLKSIVRE